MRGAAHLHARHRLARQLELFDDGHALLDNVVHFADCAGRVSARRSAVRVGAARRTGRNHFHRVVVDHHHLPARRRLDRLDALFQHLLFGQLDQIHSSHFLLRVSKRVVLGRSIIGLGLGGPPSFCANPIRNVFNARRLLRLNHDCVLDSQCFFDQSDTTARGTACETCTSTRAS